MRKFDESKLIPAVARAARIVGSPTKLAKILGISRPALYQWNQVPADRVLAIVVATSNRVGRGALRPDLFPLRSPKTRSSNTARHERKITKGAVGAHAG